MTDRVKPLKGVRNFRDFGGYATKDGRRIVRGRLFRSAHFHEATDDDRAALDALRVAAIIDLRRPTEREAQPNTWPTQGVRVIASDLGDRGEAPHIAVLKETDVTPESVDAFMRALYDGLAFEERHIALFRDWFAHLAEHNGGGVVHCAAGKDRTGLLCALTKDLLGADEEDVFEDYLLTNTVVDLSGRMPQAVAMIEAYLGRKIDPVALKPFMGVERGYLETAFAAIRERFGTNDAYLKEALGVTPDMREQIRANYLTAHL